MQQNTRLPSDTSPWQVGQKILIWHGKGPVIERITKVQADGWVLVLYPKDEEGNRRVGYLPPKGEKSK